MLMLSPRIPPLTLPLLPLMKDERAAVRTDWKLGSEVSTLAAWAIVSGRGGGLEGLLGLPFCKKVWKSKEAVS